MIDLTPHKPVVEANVSAVQPQEPVEDNVDSEEDSEDAEFEVEDEEDEEDEAFEEEGEEIYPEDELSTEVDAPLARDVEAKEASELAMALGFDSPDSALSHLGQQEKRVALTINKYSELINTSEKEVSELYEGLTTEINTLRASIDEGIRKLGTDAQVQLNDSAIGVIRTMMEQYLRTVLARSVVHAEYRGSSGVIVTDILSVLSVMGRPLYWKGCIEESVVTGDADDDDAMDEDQEEEEQEFSEEEEEEIEMDQAADDEEEDSSLSTPAFHRLIDVINHHESVELSADSYSCLQATTEDYIVSLVQASARSSHFAGRSEVTDEDVRFAQMMTQQKW